LNLKVGVGVFTSKAISPAIFQRIYTLLEINKLAAITEEYY
jgi:hypothetical protein